MSVPQGSIRVSKIESSSACSEQKHTKSKARASAGNQPYSSKGGVSTASDEVRACARAIKPNTHGNRVSIPDLKDLLRPANNVQAPVDRER